MPANRGAPGEQPDRAPDPALLPEFHAAVLDAMAEGVYVVDRARRITYWNPAAARISGFDAEQAVGRWCGDGLLNHVDDQGASMCGANCPLLATIRDGQVRTTRAHMHHEKGHLTPVRVTASPLRDGSGAIIGAVETFTDDSQVRAVEQQLRTAEMLALKDPLTGLDNRRAFDRTLEQRFAAWTRHRLPFAALAIDVDDFKAINDTHGHDTGDDVLTVIANSLANAVRATDAVFRTGGDEFAVLSGPITAPEVAELAARLRMVVSASRFAGAISASISVGSAVVADGDDAASLLRRADARLLRAKRGDVAEPDGLATSA